MHAAHTHRHAVARAACAIHRYSDDARPADTPDFCCAEFDLEFSRALLVATLLYLSTYLPTSAGIR